MLQGDRGKAVVVFCLDDYAKARVIQTLQKKLESVGKEVARVEYPLSWIGNSSCESEIFSHVNFLLDGVSLNGHRKKVGHGKILNSLLDAGVYVIVEVVNKLPDNLEYFDHNLSHFVNKDNNQFDFVMIYPDEGYFESVKDERNGKHNAQLKEMKNVESALFVAFSNCGFCAISLNSTEEKACDSILWEIKCRTPETSLWF